MGGTEERVPPQVEVDIGYTAYGNWQRQYREWACSRTPSRRICTAESTWSAECKRLYLTRWGSDGGPSPVLAHTGKTRGHPEGLWHVGAILHSAQRAHTGLLPIHSAFRSPPSPRQNYKMRWTLSRQGGYRSPILSHHEQVPQYPRLVHTVRCRGQHARLASFPPILPCTSVAFFHPVPMLISLPQTVLSKVLRAWSPGFCPGLRGKTARYRGLAMK
jgi:hypothetical protein